MSPRPSSVVETASIGWFSESTSVTKGVTPWTGKVTWVHLNEFPDHCGAGQDGADAERYSAEHRASRPQPSPPLSVTTRAITLASMRDSIAASTSASTPNAAGPSSETAGACGQRGGSAGSDSSGLPRLYLVCQQRTAGTARLSAPAVSVDAQPLSMNRLAWSKCRGLPIKGGLM